MLCFEGKWTRGRSPLNALPRGETFQLSDQDEKILRQIEAFAGDVTPAMLMLTNDQFAQLLPALVDHARMTSGRSTSVIVTKNPFGVPLRAELLENGEITLSLKEKIAAPTRLDPAGNWVFENNTFRPLGFSPAFFEVFSKPILISRLQVP